MAYSTDVAAAKLLAQQLHAAQTDKSGKPYIGHLTRVAERLEDPRARVVGYLHDSMEDAGVSETFIAERFGAETAHAVALMTHSQGMAYMDYVKRLSVDPVARQVKMSDLVDNSNLSRLEKITMRDVERQQKYNRALRFLMEMTDNEQ